MLKSTQMQDSDVQPIKSEEKPNASKVSPTCACLFKTARNETGSQMSFNVNSDCRISTIILKSNFLFCGKNLLDVIKIIPFCI